jgi:serine/threonine protein kinase
VIGKTISHFKITAKLGEGGMDEVFQAEDTKLGRQVAIKVPPAEMADDPERLARFQREARSLAALDHPNIVSAHSIEEADGVHFLVMSLAEGRTLEQVIPSEGLSPSRELELAIPLTEALAAAHAKEITHRDLKPSNVMVTDDGQVKVLDFGLAKLTEEAPSDDSIQLPTELLTREGLMVGTPSYMSPEQATGDTVGPRPDVFSLGILLYEMATGERLFKGERSAELVSSILKDTPRPVSELTPAVPKSLDRLIDLCLEKRPEERFPSAAEVVSELEALGHEAEPRPPHVESSRRRERFKIPAAAVALLGIVALT